jgi:branched-chain amino acid transport system ATP-binding protein
MLELTNLRVRYGAVEVVHGLDLRLDEGEFVAVLGANGAGKSSLMRGIVGVVDHRSDAFLLAGESFARTTSFTRVQAGISLVPEGREVFPTLTVLENLRTANDAKRKPARAFADALAEVTSLFPRLEERLAQKAGTLSGGEQQMLAIGRALVQEPRVLLLDEPSLGLAPVMIDAVFAALTQLNDRGMTILMVEQDTVRALEVVQRAMVLRTGRVVLEGPPAAMEDPSVLREAVFGS